MNKQVLLEDIIYAFDFIWTYVFHKKEKDHWTGFYGEAFLLDF